MLKYKKEIGREQVFAAIENGEAVKRVEEYLVITANSVDLKRKDAGVTLYRGYANSEGEIVISDNSSREPIILCLIDQTVKDKDDEGKEIDRDIPMFTELVTPAKGQGARKRGDFRIDDLEAAIVKWNIIDHAFEGLEVV